ncbi:MAG: NusG domain II-containing protein [Oscillospiraceae bacterium]|nr:NusG domain II-containing protein [Oscillospiraceae bacterium]MDD4367529.1 NusG domain II-containing protein [Oscillospiraceae bacterium]
MNKKGRVFARRRDIIIILAILAVALLLLGWQQSRRSQDPDGSGQLVADVYYQNQLIDTIPLISDNEQDFSYSQRPAVILHRYADGSLAFIESDCPDQICVHAGKLSQPGQFAACLPNEMLVNVRRADESAAAGVDVEQKAEEEEVDIVN